MYFLMRIDTFSFVLRTHRTFLFPHGELKRDFYTDHATFYLKYLLFKTVHTGRSSGWIVVTTAHA